MAFSLTTSGRDDGQIIKKIQLGLLKLDPNIEMKMRNGPDTSPSRDFLNSSYMDLIRNIRVPPEFETTNQRLRRFMRELYGINQARADYTRGGFHAEAMHLMMNSIGHQAILDSRASKINPHDNISGSWATAYNLQIGNSIMLSENCSKIMSKANHFFNQLETAEQKWREARFAFGTANREIEVAIHNGDLHNIQELKRIARDKRKVLEYARTIANNLQFDYTVQSSFGCNVLGSNYSYTKDDILTRSDATCGNLEIVTYGEFHKAGIKNSYPTSGIARGITYKTCNEISKDIKEGGIYKNTVLLPFPTDFMANQAYWTKVLPLYQTTNFTQTGSFLNTMWTTLTEAIMSKLNLGKGALANKIIQIGTSPPTPAELTEGLNVYGLIKTALKLEFKLQKLKQGDNFALQFLSVKAACTHANDRLQTARQININRGQTLLKHITTTSGKTNRMQLFDTHEYSILRMTCLPQNNNNH